MSPRSLTYAGAGLLLLVCAVLLRGRSPERLHPESARRTELKLQTQVLPTAPSERDPAVGHRADASVPRRTEDGGRDTQELLRVARDERQSIEARRESVHALARRGRTDLARELLAGGVDDLASECIEVLAAFGGEGDLDALSGLALSQASARLRVEAVSAMARFGDRRAVPTLGRLLEQRSHPEVVKAAVLALGRLPCEESLSLLTGFASRVGSDGEVQSVARALAALRQVGATSVDQALIDLESSPMAGPETAEIIQALRQAPAGPTCGTSLAGPSSEDSLH